MTVSSTHGGRTLRRGASTAETVTSARQAAIDGGVVTPTMASPEASRPREDGRGDYEADSSENESTSRRRQRGPGTWSGGSEAAASSLHPSAAASRSNSRSVADKDRKIGHRRVDEEGQVSYKKVSSNQLMQSIQLGIQHSIAALGRYDERDLLMQDFMTVETVTFPKGGSSTTPAHSCSDFTFRTYAPLAFRYFLNLFGIKRDDFMVSLCSEAMRELSNPGASGSIFYLTNDDEFILKTLMHKEAEFLQKLLPGYYMNLNQNPHTLLPKFFGMYCYQCNQKNIRIAVMNNLLPSNVKMHLRFDLKGSTYKRKANKHERAKASPTYKDLDFMELLPEGLLLEHETYNALISTLRRDCRVLESFRIMDYSLLVGVHNLDLAAKETSEISGNGTPKKDPLKGHRRNRAPHKQKLVAHSTAMESIQAQTEPIDEQEHLPPGGIPARNHKGERLLLFLGIIDILQSYQMRKKLEHTLKSIIHDGDTVSVHRPGFYAHRFLGFMADHVFKKIPSSLKHSPSRKSKREGAKKPDSTDGSGPPGAIPQGASTPSRPDVVPAPNSSRHSRSRLSASPDVRDRSPECGATGSSAGAAWPTKSLHEASRSRERSTGNTSIASSGSREDIVTRSYKNTPYHETEI